MPRIRSLKPEIWTDQRLAPLDPTTRLVFIGLIGNADDAGRLDDNVKKLDGLIFPETDDTCKKSLATLAEIGVIKRGKTAAGQKVVQICGWDKHQKVSHRSDKMCLPPILGDSPETLRNGSGGSPAPTKDQGPTTYDQGPPTVVESGAAAADDPTPEEFIAVWNHEVPFSPLNALPPPWRESLAARRADAGWRQDWRKALAKIRGSPFLRGEGASGWKADAEWFLRPATVTSILAGKYDEIRKRNDSSGAGSRPISRIDAPPGKYDSLEIREG